MTRLPPFARLFSRIYQSHRFLYTLIVLFLSLGMGFLSLVMFTFLALIGSYALSEHLSAGMAGMSILLIFQVVAALGALGVFLVFLIWNLRK